jgi:hypothetical protein
MRPAHEASDGRCGMQRLAMKAAACSNAELLFADSDRRRVVVIIVCGFLRKRMSMTSQNEHREKTYPCRCGQRL